MFIKCSETYDTDITKYHWSTLVWEGISLLDLFPSIFFSASDCVLDYIKHNMLIPFHHHMSHLYTWFSSHMEHSLLTTHWRLAAVRRQCVFHLNHGSLRNWYWVMSQNLPMPLVIWIRRNRLNLKEQIQRLKTITFNVDWIGNIREQVCLFWCM